MLVRLGRLVFMSTYTRKGSNVNVIDFQKYIDHLNEDRKEMELRLTKSQERLDNRIDTVMGKIEEERQHTNEMFREAMGKLDNQKLWMLGVCITIVLAIFAMR